MRTQLLLFTLLIITVSLAHCVQYAIVIKQNINLRNDKVDFPVPPNFAKLDSYEETQLLFQDCVTVENDSGDGWLRVTLPQQTTYDFPINNTVELHAYPGYIRAFEVVKLPEGVNSCPAISAPRRVYVSDNLVPLYNAERNSIYTKLSIGTVLQKVSDLAGWTTVKVMLPSGEWALAKIASVHVTDAKSNLEKALTPLFLKQAALVEVSRRFIGWPYAWGGRSSYDESVRNTTFSGVDCSGFTQLAFSIALSHDLPRNSHDQYLVAKNITRRPTDDFRVGDLLFLGRTDRLRMSHVMIYIGDGKIMESAGTVGSRIIKLTDKLTGVSSISDLCYGCNVVDRGSVKRFYWGRILE